MARVGTKTDPTKEDYILRPEIPANKKYPAAEWNYLSDKCQNPGVKDAFQANILNDDWYVYEYFVQSGAISFTKDASVTSSGVGNGACGTFQSDGSAVSVSGDFRITKPSSFSAGTTYFYFFVWEGTEFIGFIFAVSSIAATTPSTDDKGAAASATSGDGQDSGINITNSPDGMVLVLVNGVQQTLGDGVKTKDCYFSNDAGATARAIGAIAAADSLYWNGTIAGFDLAVTDIIDLNYNA